MFTIVLGSGSASPGQTCCPVGRCAVKAHSEPCVAASGLEGRGQVGLGLRWGGWVSQVRIQVLGHVCKQGAVWHGMVVSLKDWSGLQWGSLAEAGTFWCLLLPRRDCDNPFPFINHVFLVVLCDPAQSCCQTSQARDLPCTLQLFGCPLRKLETCCGHRTEGHGGSQPGCSNEAVTSPPLHPHPYVRILWGPSQQSRVWPS